MKKALLFSTAAAVVALPTLAGAQVSVSGPSGNVQVDFSHNESINNLKDMNYSNDTVKDAEHDELTSMDLDWSMSGKNCCFSYGGFVGIKAQSDESAASSNDVLLDDANIYIDMGTAGRLEFGIDGSASKGVFDRDYLSKGPLSGGTSILNVNSFANGDDNDSFGATKTLGDTSVEYTNTIAGFSIALEHDLEESEWEAGVGYSLALGGSSVDLAAATTSADSMGVTAAATFGDYSVKVGYAEDGDDETSTYLGAATTFSGIGLSLEYVMNDAAVDQTGTADQEASSDELIAGASYSLAPGLTASASVAMASYEGDNDTSVANTVAGTYGDGDITKMAVRLKLGF